jgi:hypothetical protein
MFGKKKQETEVKQGDAKVTNSLTAEDLVKLLNEKEQMVLALDKSYRETRNQLVGQISLLRSQIKGLLGQKDKA